ncbi:hypothetical protein [Planctomicrobium sp. SH664]|uniref:hypothetical protein n=1 Tax=Planctomicrobium sp. SH664 TaxID=3448125 RepID=UPI003F5B34EE
MPIDFRCECGFQSRLKDEFQGKKIKCPQCKKPSVVGEEKKGTAKGKKSGKPSDEQGDLLSLNLDSFSHEEIEVIDPAVLAKQQAEERKRQQREERRKNGLGPGVILGLALTVLASAGVIAALIFYVIPTVKEKVGDKSAEVTEENPAGGAPPAAGKSK